MGCSWNLRLRILKIPRLKKMARGISSRLTVINKNELINCAEFNAGTKGPKDRIGGIKQ